MKHETEWHLNPHARTFLMMMLNEDISYTTSTNKTHSNTWTTAFWHLANRNFNRLDDNVTETDLKWKKAPRETQTLRTKIFSPTADPFQGAQDRQNLISWRRSLPAPTDRVWLRSMHAISSYHGNRHRSRQTLSARCKRRPRAHHKHTYRQERLLYTAQCNEWMVVQLRSD